MRKYFVELKTYSCGAIEQDITNKVRFKNICTENKILIIDFAQVGRLEMNCFSDM